MPTHKIAFPGSQGATLAGRLDTPDQPPHAWAIFAHCFTCSKDSKAAAYISRALAQAGFGVLRFDFTGLGGSDGDFANTHFSSNVDDLIAAADWLRAEHGAPSLLIGHSLGGAAVLAAAGREPDNRAVATIGAPCDPAHVVHQLGEGVAQIHAEGEATVQLAGRPFTIRRAFIDDLKEQRQVERIHALRRPLMLLHAPLDETVAVDNAARIYQAAMHPKSFVALDGADHLLTRPEDAQFAADVMATWARRYLGTPQSRSRIPQLSPMAMANDAAQAGTAAAPQDDVVHVAERGSGPYTVDIRAGRHQWQADEPADVGGQDVGPTPHQMLTAALGACTAITIRMVADRRQWPLARVSVALRHSRVDAAEADGTRATASARTIDRFERRITLEGQLDAAQRQSLLEMANKCPVHRTLTSEVQIQTTLVHADEDRTTSTP
ncbi:MAG: alpha/beta fold hydrolase [Rhodoferax sp.]|nr:alpha/beta fold hydrolase [Rhodoferax sp.]